MPETLEIPTLKLPYDDYAELLAAIAATLDCARWTDSYHMRLAKAFDKIKDMEREFNANEGVSESPETQELAILEDTNAAGI